MQWAQWVGIVVIIVAGLAGNYYFGPVAKRYPTRTAWLMVLILGVFATLNVLSGQYVGATVSATCALLVEVGRYLRREQHG